MKIEATIVDGRILAKAGPIKGRPGLILAGSKTNPKARRWQKISGWEKKRESKAKEKETGISKREFLRSWNIPQDRSHHPWDLADEGSFVPDINQSKLETLYDKVSKRGEWLIDVPGLLYQGDKKQRAKVVLDRHTGEIVSID